MIAPSLGRFPWQAPYTFWSLSDMKQLLANRVALLASHLENTCQKAKTREAEEISDHDRGKLLENIEGIARELEVLDLESPQDQVTRVRNMLGVDGTIDGRVPTNPDIYRAFHELNARFEDELGRQLCFIVPREKAKLYTDPQLFGTTVADHFPSATLDVEEAGKCLALQRGTASVFHLMRVMEAGLKAVASALGIPYAPSWESYLKQIQTQLELEWKKKPRKWRTEEPFFRDVHANLFAVKLAWRNPTMHIVNSYTPDMAEEVFNAVRGFMRHIATKLSDAPPKKVKP